jgi:hypothetical protein
MIKTTNRANITVDVKVVDLDISCLYSCNHMVGMDKISSNANSTQNLLFEEMVCNHYTTCLYSVNMHPNLNNQVFFMVIGV